MESGRVGQLILTGLAEGLPGVTREWGAALAQAGAVCFEDQNHKNGVELKVNGTFTARYRVYWQQVTEQTLRCWGDREEATEHGAYGVAFLIVLDLTEYTVIKRSYKGTGFDYWLGEKDDKLFQEAARLEVSGIRSGSDSIVKTRVRKKLRQVKPSDAMSLPAYIVVVEFSAPLSELVKK